MEKRAAEAERASIKYKQVEFLSSRIGETFTGLVNGTIGKACLWSWTATSAKALCPSKPSLGPMGVRRRPHDV